jgi:hypothetical protein
MPGLGETDLVRSAPGVVRVAATGWWRAVNWTFENTTRAGGRIIKAAMDGQSPAQIAHDTGTELRSFARRALGVEASEPVYESAKHLSTEELRRRGAELLRQSADVRFREDMHPAFERVLDEIAPDEARILRFLAREGAQPTVDVRTNRPFGVGSELVAEGLSMIGELAGCRHPEKTKAYLNNLFRLGLLWLSRDPVEPARYQVIEVQPDVAAAMRRAGRSPKTVRRSVYLTPFGEDFCTVCLPEG